MVAVVVMKQEGHGGGRSGGSGCTMTGGQEVNKCFIAITARSTFKYFSYFLSAVRLTEDGLIYFTSFSKARHHGRTIAEAGKGSLGVEAKVPPP